MRWLSERSGADECFGEGGVTGGIGAGAYSVTSEEVGQHPEFSSTSTSA
jgi:hypothetical protein